MNEINLSKKRCSLKERETICKREQFEQIDNILIGFSSKTSQKETSENIQTPEAIKEEPIKELKFKLKETLRTEDKPTKQLLEKQNDETFDLLPLPFLQKLNACEIRKNSLTNGDNQKKWKDFLNKLPESQYETVSRALEKYWRWKLYKKYIPEERTNFRKTMSCGPKLDQLGRLPIPEELNKFRISGESKQKPEKFKNYLKKGNGVAKLGRNKG